MKKLAFILFTALCTNAHAQDIKKAYFEDALRIVLSFESSSSNIDDAYGKVTPNFDGNGISVGLLQWNIGMGSLQSLVKQVGKNTVLETMPKFGEEFWKACNIKKADGLKIVNSWQINDSVVKDEQLKELVSFLNAPNVKEAQYNEALKQGRVAYTTAAKWAKELRQSDSVTFKEFVYFLDLYTFNDGLKGLWVKDVNNFTASNAAPKDTILTWLNTRGGDLFGLKDAKDNVKEWGKMTIASPELELFILGYLRALISNGTHGRFKADVLNRRGTICLGKGTVHRDHYNFEKIYSKYK